VKNKLALKNGDLKKRLDEIDKRVYEKAFTGFYESRLEIFLGEWEKGKEIVSFLGGVKTTLSWRELERQTGRGDDALKKWHDLYQKHPKYDEYLKIIEKKAHEWTIKALNPKNKEVIAMLHTGDQESYTPQQYVESARKIMGSIDLDPASNEYANRELVKATTYFSAEDDGLSKEWKEKVWLNPPYEYPLIKNFIDKLIAEFKSNNVSDAILLTNNNTDTQWFHDAAINSQIVCFTKGRINFHKEDGSLSQPTNGQSFFYFGDKKDFFAQEFKKYGLIMTVVNNE